MPVLVGCSEVSVTGTILHPHLNGAYERLSQSCESSEPEYYIQKNESDYGAGNNCSNYIFFWSNGLGHHSRYLGWVIAPCYCHNRSQVAGYEDVDSPDQVSGMWAEVHENGTWYYNEDLKVDCEDGEYTKCNLRFSTGFCVQIVTVIIQ